MDVAKSHAMGGGQVKHTYEQWQQWFDEKIERDFNVKILFDAEKAEVQDDYNALKRVFGATSLASEV